MRASFGSSCLLLAGLVACVRSLLLLLLTLARTLRALSLRTNSGLRARPRSAGWRAAGEWPRPRMRSTPAPPASPGAHSRRMLQEMDTIPTGACCERARNWPPPPPPKQTMKFEILLSRNWQTQTNGGSQIKLSDGQGVFFSLAQDEQNKHSAFSGIQFSPSSEAGVASTPTAGRQSRFARQRSSIDHDLRPALWPRLASRQSPVATCCRPAGDLGYVRYSWPAARRCRARDKGKSSLIFLPCSHRAGHNDISSLFCTAGATTTLLCALEPQLIAAGASPPSRSAAIDHFNYVYIAPARARRPTPPRLACRSQAECGH